MKTEVKETKSFLNPSTITAGFVAVLVGYASSAIIVYQAAMAAQANTEQAISWLMVLGLGMGISSIVLSLTHKMPIFMAWSTPGAALLVTSLDGVNINEAVGVFLFSSFLILLCGLTKLFERFTQYIPLSLANALLAGVLFQFGLNVFVSLESQLMLGSVMLLSFFILRSFIPLYTIPLVLLIGCVMAYFNGSFDLSGLQLGISMPVWTTPEFDLMACISVGIPLFVITMASQNMPGVAVLKAHGYKPPVSKLINATGLTGLVFGPFGGFAYNLSAITAAICMSDSAGRDDIRPYYSTIWGGIFYLIAGLFAAAVVTLFAAFPKELVMIIAGLALLNTITHSLSETVKDENDRDIAVLTFIVTASGFSLFQIGSAFWAVLLGMTLYHLKHFKLDWKQMLNFAK